MTMFKHTDEAGRSMVEMLGVLAIIGVLSVGGISGYSKAMAKYKLTKAQDQITMLLMNIRTAYATSPSYSGLDEKSAGDYNLAPNEMVVKDAEGKTTKLQNTFGGEVKIGTLGDNSSNTYFYIQLQSLGKEACRTLLSSDWGADGLVGIWAAASATTSGSGNTCSDKNGATATDVTNASWCVANLPVPFGVAGHVCHAETNSITWVYY